MLTEEMLDIAQTLRQKYKDDKVFDHGTFIYEIDGETIEATWSAVIGAIGDWAIYHDAYMLQSGERRVRIIQSSGSPLPQEVLNCSAWGRKVHHENLIRKLVPCTQGAFDRYRF